MSPSKMLLLWIYNIGGFYPVGSLEKVNNSFFHLMNLWQVRRLKNNSDGTMIRGNLIIYRGFVSFRYECRYFVRVASDEE